MEQKEGPYSRRPGEVIKEETEQITAAALEYKGELFTGGNHIQALDLLEVRYPDHDKKEVRSGYITNKNRFIDRGEAPKYTRAEGSE
jgi:hypothetical protein